MRFARSERALHWLLAGTFASLLVSGWLRASLAFGPVWHKGSAVAMVAGIVLIFARGRRRRVLRASAADFAFGPEDRRWLQTAPMHVLGRAPAPAAGRFNAGQKVHARILAVALPLALASGIAGLLGVPGGGLHGVIAYASAALIGSHVFMAVVNPATRHSMHGMVCGTVRREWAGHHHALWLAGGSAIVCDAESRPAESGASAGFDRTEPMLAQQGW